MKSEDDHSAKQLPSTFNPPREINIIPIFPKSKLESRNGTKVIQLEMAEVDSKTKLRSDHKFLKCSGFVLNLGLNAQCPPLSSCNPFSTAVKQGKHHLT